MKPMVSDGVEAGAARLRLARRYTQVRARTEALAAPLSSEDQTIQSMPDVSPTRWHRAHPSWFFETFVLTPHLRGYCPFDPSYVYLFNSYYDGVGPRHPRAQRGLLSRPGNSEIARYRAHVDAAMGEAIAKLDDAAPLIELGLHHEEQHQELILMDIKHVLSMNPLQPPYQRRDWKGGDEPRALAWLDFAGGLRAVGHAGDGFAFDNESPRHNIWLEPFRLAARLSTCGEYLAFIADGGYRRPELWLSDGWACCEREGWAAPLYWRQEDGAWSIFTLAGPRSVDAAEPVSHVSFYEADAFARWAGKRLPTEGEWEVAALDQGVSLDGNLMHRGMFHPAPATAEERLQQMVGDLWEWTASPYVAYPRYRPAGGAIGEYNGKFMSNQMVLRVGSAVTPVGHVRLTYRNFFPPAARWVFGGIRLAEDA